VGTGGNEAAAMTKQILEDGTTGGTAMITQVTPRNNTKESRFERETLGKKPTHRFIFVKESFEMLQTRPDPKSQ
jgi:hypothetical protein